MRWEDYTHGLCSDDAALMDAFRRLTDGLTDSAEHVNKSEVRFKRHRTYAIAFIKAHRLEVAINLLREIEHPLLRDRFFTTASVVTHRLSITQSDQLDDYLTELVSEAYETVGPGTPKRLRGRRPREPDFRET